jgi:hypothetical protein
LSVLCRRLTYNLWLPHLSGLEFTPPVLTKTDEPLLCFRLLSGLYSLSLHVSILVVSLLFFLHSLCLFFFTSCHRSFPRSPSNNARVCLLLISSSMAWTLASHSVRLYFDRFLSWSRLSRFFFVLDVMFSFSLRVFLQFNRAHLTLRWILAHGMVSKTCIGTLPFVFWTVPAFLRRFPISFSPLSLFFSFLSVLCSLAILLSRHDSEKLTKLSIGLLLVNWARFLSLLQAQGSAQEASRLGS